MKPLLLPILIAVFLAACDHELHAPDATPEDDGGGADAGRRREDAGNSGTEGGPRDGGNTDGGPSDAGPESCSEPGGMRVGSCGNCGHLSQRCTEDLIWTDVSACIGEGECSPGAAETEALPHCGSRARLCLESCAWTDWEELAPEADCDPGATRTTTETCDPGFQVEQTCDETCQWVSDPLGCVDGCGGTRRTTPAEAEERCVPEGPFIRGTETPAELAPSCSPVNEVHVSAYYIDRYPVSNDRFRACVADGACTPPSIPLKGGSNPPRASYDDPTRGRYPVQGITWEQARAFCEWDGRRLPTEAELEKAARGPSPRAQPYVWDTPDLRCDLVDIAPCGWTSPYSGAERSWIPWEIDGVPGGRSYYWVDLLIGAGRQWASDFYAMDYYDDPASLTNPLGPASGAGHSTRGVDPTDTDIAHYHVSSRSSGAGVSVTFRCARDAS